MQRLFTVCLVFCLWRSFQAAPCRSEYAKQRHDCRPTNADETARLNPEPPSDVEAHHVSRCASNAPYSTASLGRTSTVAQRIDLLTTRLEDSEEDEEAVESSLFPGVMVPVEVEKSLVTLLSHETVRWIESEDASGRSHEGGYYKGVYISPDMKDTIQSFIEHFDEEAAATRPIIDVPTGYPERGTDVGSPCYDPQKRRTLDRDCRSRRSVASSTPLRRTVQKWYRQLRDAILRKEVLLVGVSFLLVALSIAAWLFVYGFSDICAGCLQRWQSMKGTLDKLEELPQDTSPDPQERPQRPSTRRNAGLKLREGCNHGRSNSKKRTKSHSKPKSDVTDARRDAKAVPIKGMATAQSGPEEKSDVNNEWQEVVHSKPKGRLTRMKQEEEKIFPLVRKPPSSQPSTPKTPELQQSSPVTSEKSENGDLKLDKMKRADMEAPEMLDSAMPSLRLMVPDPGLRETAEAVDVEVRGLPRCEAQMLQQSPGQSPFAASTDLPFGTSYTTQSYPSETPFQSKIDCLLKNLRNKPFSLHPVSAQSPIHSSRRAMMEMEEQLFLKRCSSFQRQNSLSGSLDATLSASGMLNNRLNVGYPNLWSEEMGQPWNGLPPTGHPLRMQQRSGSLPLTQPQTQPYYPLHRQGSLSGVKSVHALSNDCSLFSSNPSIWSMDMELDRDLVKSSMSSSASFRPMVTSPSDSLPLDYKHCLPDQLLSEVSSFPDPEGQ